MNTTKSRVSAAVNRGVMNEQCVQQVAYLAGSAARDRDTLHQGGWGQRLAKKDRSCCNRDEEKGTVGRGSAFHCSQLVMGSGVSVSQHLRQMKQ